MSAVYLDVLPQGRTSPHPTAKAYKRTVPDRDVAGSTPASSAHGGV